MYLNNIYRTTILRCDIGLKTGDAILVHKRLFHLIISRGSHIGIVDDKTKNSNMSGLYGVSYSYKVW